MPYLLSDEQRQITEAARRRLTDSYSGERLKALLETPGAFDEMFWDQCREMGWTALAIPEAYGGLGLGALELGLISLECGKVACGAPYLTTSYAVAEALRLWGDEALRARCLPLLATGDLRGAVAVTEAPGLRFQGGRLSGVQPWVPAGAGADVAVAPVAGEAGGLLVLVDLNQEGVSRTAPPTLDSSRGLADLTFDGVPATPLDPPDAQGALQALSDRLAIITAFEQLGGAETCLGLARDYALQRYAFGQPIGKFQAIKHRIAEMYVLNELARGNALAAALSLSEGRADTSLRAAAARLSATAAYEFAAGEAIQVHGAIGVSWEHDLHLHYRRARSTAVEYGAAAVWEDRLAVALAEAH